MTKQSEDTMYMIHTELTESKLWDKFNKQLKKMDNQGKHKYKEICERWEYAFNKIKTTKEKGYENTHLDKKRRSNKR